MLNFACISPHPPLIIPTIGEKGQRQKVEKTIKALKKLGAKLNQKNLDTLLIISPHLPLLRKQFSIFTDQEFKGDLQKFRDFETTFSFSGNPNLAVKINKNFKKNGISSSKRSLKKLDHGSLVPLYFLTRKNKEEENKFKLTPLTFCDVDLKTHLEAGKSIGKIIDKKEANIGVCASGDLSHRLKKGAPAGFSPKGKKFDQKLIQSLRQKDIKKILNIDNTLTQKAGECGLRSIVMLLGVLKTQSSWNPQILSYQGPFGVGYLTANFQLT